ncbi:Gfo/Idh/MocA family oxidoreductase [Saccharomonospora sp. NPDC046836]|uniref:Gfo/Idh/MocA family protein n=1 Tax=Saccharomonospora sp. NPDC046836 TaxID=3156921 RepID=UPI0033E6C0EC
MSAPHRIALVGAGAMGSLHARVLASHERTTLVRVVDPYESAGQALADQYGAVWTPGMGTLSDVDAVVLASPTELHHKQAVEVLHAGKPLLVEKPLSNSLAAVAEILEFARRADVPLMCGLLERYNPAVLTARALIEQPVHLVARRHGPYAPRIRTGVAWDLLVHDVDLAIQFFGGCGPTATVSGTGHFHPDSAGGAEDTVDAVLTFPTGLATISASRLGQRKVRSLVVSELDRMIEIDLLRRDVTVYRHVSHDAATPEGRGYRQQAIVELPELVTAREPLATQLDRFVDLLDGVADAEPERASILPAHEVVDRVLASAT